MTVDSLPALLALVLPPHWYPSWWRAPTDMRIPPMTWFTSLAVYAGGKITGSVQLESAMTHAELILLAAADLDGGGCVFTMELLAVTAWERFPEAVHLRGYECLPDSGRVESKVYGYAGLTGARGWLEHLGSKRLRMTPKGRRVARELARRVA